VNKFKCPPPISKTSNDNDVVLHFIGNVLQCLSSRSVTGNAAKQLVVDTFSTMSELQQKWCQRIILKNMRCGVQESTVNKVWPGTLNSFAVALASTVKSEFVAGEGIKILEPVNYPVRVEPKLDGLRCIAVKHKGEVTFYTRNGTVLETLPRIKKALENANYDNMVLDAEAMSSDWNDSIHVIMSKKTKHDDSEIVLNVFDALSYEDWISQSSHESYNSRLAAVSVIVSSVNNPCVKQVPHIMAKNESELKEFFAECMSNQFEGVMLKTLNTPYLFKRSDNIKKLKPCVTYEGVIVGHYDGRRGTKREGLFNGIEVVFPNGIVTRVGSGFTDSIRTDVQLNGPDSYIGKIVEIEAQPDPMTLDGLSKDGKARFPVFCRFRDESDVDPKVIAAGVKYFEEL
jgi:ATP-dependent DNA ligase